MLKLTFLPASIQAIMLPIVSKDDTSALQSFTLMMAVAIPLFFMIILPWWFAQAVPIWPVLLSMLLCLIHIAKVQVIYPFYVLWMIIASILGWVNTHIILFLIYCIMILPTGLFMQAVGKLQYKKGTQLHIKGTATCTSYVIRDTKPTKQNLKEPF